MRNKRFLSLLVAAVLVCGLVGCQADVDTGQVDTEQTVQESQQTTETTTGQNEQVTKVSETTKETTSAQTTQGVTETMDFVYPDDPLTVDNLNITVKSENDFENILNYTNVEILYLDFTSLETDLNNLDILTEMSNVKELTIQGTIDLKYVSQMKQLETLYVSHFNGEFKSLAENNTIKKLIIEEVYIDTLDGIENLTSLEQFSASHVRFDDRSALGKLTSLKKVSFFIDETLLIDMSFIRSLNDLESFGCYALYEIKNADSIGECTNLTYLSINADIENIAFVENLPNLQTFELCAANDRVYEIEKLSSCSKLETVSLNCNYSEESLENLKKVLSNCKFNR